MEAANGGSAASYGDDEWTAHLCDRVRELFEIDCEVFLVFNGTAANALALAQLCRPFHSVICHEYAHIENDECGAVEFFSGGSKLIPTRGTNGKLELAEMEGALARQHELHSHKPRVISITQATELGTVYAREEIETIADFAHSRAMLLHTDGARFANAVASLGCRPKEISWQAGVDVLCFGGTKNGLAAGELVVFFDKQLGREFEYRAKQAGQLASKMRVVAAPWLALLTDEVWLRNAEHANAAAKRLAEMVRRCDVEIVLPVQTNAVFARLSSGTVSRLQAQLYKFIEPDIYRLMCSWATTGEELAELAGNFEAARPCAGAAAWL